MRIGLFTTDFPFKGPFSERREEPMRSLWGGVAEVVYHLALSLDAQGHTVKVFTTSPTDEDVVREHRNVAVYGYHSDLRVASTFLSSKLLWKPLEHDLDLVHGHMGTPPGSFAAFNYSRFKRVPLVTTIHTPYNEVSREGASYAKRTSLQLFMNYVLTPLLNGSDAITTVSRPVLEETPSYRPFIPRATLIENGVDTGSLILNMSKGECRERLGIGQEKRVVLFVGSLTPYKNPELLLNAFSGLCFERSDPYLVMLGDGVLRGTLTDRSMRLGMQDRVRIPGFVSEQDKLLYYGASDIFVLPSLAEAFPLTIIEASFFGLPLLLSDIDVFKAQVEDHRNGLLFRGGDENNLREKLTQMLGDEGERAELGRNSRTFAETHDWSALVARYCDIYRNLVHGSA